MCGKKWEEHELKFLKDNYELMIHQEIADELGRTKVAVDVKLKKMRLIRDSKYKYNQNFFKEINTEEKAYWLGFIYADGCVVYNEKTRNYELCIKLQKGDYKHLKKFNKAIEGNLEVTTFTREMNFNHKEYDGCEIRFYSKQLATDLISHGVIPNKTLVMELPFIKEGLIHHFIRGYFDGDGCISKDSKKRRTFQVNFTSGSLKFLELLRKELYKNNVNSYFYQENNNTYRLYIKGLNNCNKFLEYIYKDATIYLERKFIKKNNIYQEYDVAQRLLL